MEPIFTGMKLSKKARPRCTTVCEDRDFANVAKRQARLFLLLNIMLNFRDQQEEGSVLKLVETDSTRQILKLIDQLYVPYLNDNIAKITDNGQQYKKNWQQRHWRSVFFSDESRFCFDFHNGRRLVSRSKGKRYADC